MALRYRTRPTPAFGPAHSPWSWLCTEDQSDALPSLMVLAEAQPEGGYTLTSPLLPELITEYDTPDELAPNLADALQAVAEFYEDDGEPLPVDLSHVFVVYGREPAPAS